MHHYPTEDGVKMTKKNQEKHIQQIVEWQKFIDKMLLAIFKIIKN